jgi:predicted DNA-binding transcriptional regulator AlpA
MKQNQTIDDLPDSGFIRLRFLTSTIIPFSTSTLWRKVRKGEFPSPLKLSANVTAWRIGDVREWLADPTGYQSKHQLGD